MKLTPDQTQAVTSWIAQGASISEVQKRLRDEFQVSLTYIDTRFLIDDLGLNLKAAPAPVKQPPAPPPVPPAAAPVDAATELVDDEADPYADEAAEFAEEEPLPEPAPGAAATNVKVEVDRLTRPGTVVSGTVSFTDGTTGKWALDQYGRLMFEGAQPGQRPSQADLQAFQVELSRQLQRKGF